MFILGRNKYFIKIVIITNIVIITLVLVILCIIQPLRKTEELVSIKPKILIKTDVNFVNFKYTDLV